MSNFEIKKIAIADDARVRIVAVEHRGEKEFEDRTYAYQNNMSPVQTELDYHDTDTGEFQLLIDATLVAPGYIDDDYPDEYESIEEYVNTMSHYVETAISMYDDTVEVTVGVEHYDPKFELEYDVKRIRDQEEWMRSLYDPQKNYDQKVKELTFLANGKQIAAVKQQIAKNKAETSIDYTAWIKQLEEEVLPQSIETQAKAVETLKTISIVEFEDKYTKKMTHWQAELDQAIQELEAA
jgi:hypothetical protein